MTLEEELALIKKNKAPLGTVVPSAKMGGQEVAPAPQPAPEAAKAPAPLTPPVFDPAKAAQPKPAPQDDLPPAQTGLEPLPGNDASTWDVIGAAWTAETIKTDAWSYTASKRADLANDLFSRLPDEAKQRIVAKNWDYANNWTPFEDMVLDEVAQAALADPQAWGDAPQSRDAFDARITTERKTELADAQGVLDQPGGGFSEFVGSGARSMTDEISLLMAPLGVQGGAVRTILSEAVLGGLGEAAILPREFRVARELDLPTPDVLSRVLTGAALGGGLSAGIMGIAKGIGLLRTRRASIREASPGGSDALHAEIAIDRAEADMLGDRTVQDVINPKLAPLPGAEDLPYNEGATLRAIIGVESGGKANAKNPSSSAYGAGQFIASTWLGMIRKYRPDLTAGKTDNEILALRGDATISTEMTAMYARENAATLKANGLPVDPGTIYLSHFMGPGGAVKALKAPLDAPISSLMSPREIAANKGIRFGGKSFADFTAGDLRRWVAYKMRNAFDPNASRDMPDFSGGTSRGYTGEGQVSTGGGNKIDVTYEVVDMSTLLRASGDLQPRDRSRGNSDAWIADTAARLDPAQLMPSPTADRGAPIVGADDIIDSGNGRASAIARAYEYHPDRAAAYRARIEAEGYAIPEGVTRPVLIARRTTDLSHDERVRFAIDAQDSGVAAMTPTEVARASSRTMTAPVLGQLDPAQALTAEANAGFVRAALASLPRSARNAMFDAGGMLNRNGERQLREAIFARAWSDPDIIEMFTEADQGDLKSLMEALGRAAPSWAALKADIEAGLVRPEMDISAHILDAMRMIATARKLANRHTASRKRAQNIQIEPNPAASRDGQAGQDGAGIGKVLTELLDEVDMIEGAVSPLTAALVQKFWRNGRSASADDVATFLTRYADDARKAGAEGGMFDAPGPRDVLRAIDKDAFGNLPENLGQPRGFARPGQNGPQVKAMDQGYDAGAASPEIEADDAAVRDALEAPPPAEPALQRPPEDTASDTMQAEIAAARADLGDMMADMTFDLEDGTTVSFRDMLDDLDAEADVAAAVRACAITPGGA